MKTGICNFCGSTCSYSELVSGPNKVYICKECTDLATNIYRERMVGSIVSYESILTDELAEVMLIQLEQYYGPLFKYYISMYKANKAMFNKVIENMPIVEFCNLHSDCSEFPDEIHCNDAGCQDHS